MTSVDTLRNNSALLDGSLSASAHIAQNRELPADLRELADRLNRDAAALQREMTERAAFLETMSHVGC